MRDILAQALPVAVVVAVGVVALSRQAASRTRQLAAIERKLQLLMEHAGITESQLVIPEVALKLDSGSKIQAIKAYREATGASLREARDAVDQLARQRSL